jgi:hypothetical protein
MALCPLSQMVKSQDFTPLNPWLHTGLNPGPLAYKAAMLINHKTMTAPKLNASKSS